VRWPVSVAGWIGGAILFGLALNQGWVWAVAPLFLLWGTGLIFSLRSRIPRARHPWTLVLIQPLAASAALILCLVTYSGLQDQSLAEHGGWETAVVTSRSAALNSGTDSYEYAYTLRAVHGPAIHGYLNLDSNLPIGKRVTVRTDPGGTANPSLSRPPSAGYLWSWAGCSAAVTAALLAAAEWAARRDS
jgi:hypothetical protein